MTSADEWYRITVGGDSMPRKKSGEFDQGKYIAQYMREHITYKKMTINDGNPEDQLIAQWIDSQPESTSAYLKRLVLEDMMRRQGGSKA